MSQAKVHLHAYAGRENGLMIIGTAEALSELGRELQAVASHAPENHPANWPAQIAVLNSASPYLDRPDYRVSFHVQTVPLPEVLQRRSRQAPRTATFLAIAALVAVGAVSLLTWALNAL